MKPLLHFRPHPGTFLCGVLGVLLLTALIGYLQQGFFAGHWWSAQYMASLLIPFSLVPALIWLGYVPARLEFSQHAMLIRLPFRPARELPWSDLRYWRQNANMLFVVQFRSGEFQLPLFAFSRAQRRQFTGFMSGRFPQYEVKGWLARRRAR
ncbi:MAG TPA: hypothetical protein VM639_13150 [Dongiaceae bacterium]|nr:hypothetical protein [Dongiaceae bacterium]